MKQMLVVRKDLKMRTGKVAAQAAHASLGLFLKYQGDQRLTEWLAGSFTKVCVYVESEDELLDVVAKAEDSGLMTCLITDNGLTEFHGILTKTVAAIGPATHEELTPITGHLKLL